jgi:dipeptidyl aminopeptidase/acylaminoacyl peptidase
MTAASPVTHATKDDPPCLLIHGTEDPTAPYNQAVRMNDALSKAGGDVTLITIDGGGHGVPNRGVREFFARHLLGQDVKVSTDAIK